MTSRRFGASAALGHSLLSRSAFAAPVVAPAVDVAPRSFVRSGGTSEIAGGGGATFVLWGTASGTACSDDLSTGRARLEPLPLAAGVVFDGQTFLAAAASR
jgi:hypothetical protein